MPSKRGLCLGECAFKKGIMFREMCLHKDRHGYVNVPSEKYASYSFENFTETDFGYSKPGFQPKMATFLKTHSHNHDSRFDGTLP